MGQPSIFPFCFQVRGLVFLQRTMINDESNVLSCSKRAFFHVLEGVVLKTFLGQAPISLLSSHFAFKVVTGLSFLCHPMIWPGMSPFPKHWGCYLCYLSVQQISTSWYQSNEDFHRLYTFHIYCHYHRRGGIRGGLEGYGPPSEHASPPSEGGKQFFGVFWRL